MGELAGTIAPGLDFYLLVGATLLVMLYNLVVLLFSHERNRKLGNLVSFFAFGIPWLLWVVTLSLA